MEAISNAGTCIGVLANDGIVLCAERMSANKLLDEVKVTEKIYKLSEYVFFEILFIFLSNFINFFRDIVCSVAGITSDANVLTNELRTIAQLHLRQHGEPVPVERLVCRICDIKQAYTQYGGKRPFGVSILYIGWDEHYGFQLYQSDPSGNYSGWKATCIGKNSSAAVALLETDHKVGETNLTQAIQLAINTLGKTMDSQALTIDKLEIATLTRENGKSKITVLSLKEVEKYVKEFEAKQAAEAAAKKEKEKEQSKK